MSPLWIAFLLIPALARAERFSCRGRILGAYYADAKANCKAFHVCVRVAGGGVRDFRFFCPPGTLFHQEAQTCTDWGDDDPLACPADLYDGQFDLYKIGSGFDTKKISSSGSRDDEAEFGLQRAESGDRRLAQNQPASDLRASHSSDFFSGQRERGRDEPQPSAAPAAPPSASRQSFRRVPHRIAPTAAPATVATSPSAPPAPPSPVPQIRYDQSPKRKLVRKRPVYTPSTTFAPSTFAQNSSPRPRQQFFEQPQPQQNVVRRPADEAARPPQAAQPTQPPSPAPQYNEEYVEVSRVTPKQQPNRFYPSTAPSPVPFSQPASSSHFTKKDGLTELYNYEAQSTPAFSQQHVNRPLKATLRNGFNVSPAEFNYDAPRKNVEVSSNGIRGSTGSADYDGASKTFSTSTPAYRNFNSVSYESEKKSFSPYSGAKQNFANDAAPPSTASSRTAQRAEPPLNLNTVAYKTNVGFDARPINYVESDEDDGQYRLPHGEDDGQYRPELYERELLSGAHSQNIAASGNRLFDDQKPRSRPDHSAAPRPFSASPAGTSPPQPRTQPTYTQPPYTQQPQTQRTYTQQPQTQRTYTQPPQTQPPYTQPPQTQRTFDYYQTYTTTSRPSDAPAAAQSFAPSTYGASSRQSTAPATRATERAPELRPAPSRAPPAPSAVSKAPHPAPQPHPAQPKANKEDASYDYAYYDTDPGFTEYDNIEEFGKTKKKV